jgi:hypothetical protein
MSAVEIEAAIRRMPQTEARDLLQRLEDLRRPVGKFSQISDDVVAKWRVKSGFGAGLTTEEYLRIIRDGDRD